MKTLYYSHPDFLLHDTGMNHPESPNRFKVISKALAAPTFDRLIKVEPPLGTDEQIRLIHSAEHIKRLKASVPKQGLHYLDNDTTLSPGSLTAAFRAVGAACDAVDKIVAGAAQNAFCAVRPPGHHAEPNRAMGFCLFNTIAIAAEYARRNHKLERVAIVDFDVHHGNGTQAAFYNQSKVLYASSHQMPHYPGTGSPDEKGVGNIFNVPLAAGTTGDEFRDKYRQIIFPALRAFKPEFLFISAGFDAHKDDPLASLGLVEDDYRWVTHELMQIGKDCCGNRIVSALEGGYNLTALAASVASHVKTLMGSQSRLAIVQ